MNFRHRACPPLSSPLTLSAIPTSRVYVAVLIELFPIVPCTSPPLFVYLLRSDLLLALRRSVLHCLLRSDIQYFSYSTLWSSHYTFIFYFDTALLSICDVLDLLRYVTFFITWLHYALLQPDHSPQLCLLRSAFYISDLLNYYCSAHALICLDQLSQICYVFCSSGPSNFS